MSRTRSPHRCSRCGREGHNARNCRTHMNGPDALTLLRVAVPSWIAAAQRMKNAEARVQELISDELRAAWQEQAEAMAQSNEVALACDALIRALPDERSEKIYAALRQDGFDGLLRELGMSQ